ncbi:MAG: InlB B-repeat-containing protein, partial [Prevotella sp.]
ISGSVTFFAYWVSASATTVKVIYNANGGTGGFTQNVEAGKAVALPSAGLSKAGNLMSGWALGSATGTAYDLGAKYIVSNAVTFYAMWAGSSSVMVVNFSFNGGTGSAAPQNLTVGGKATIPTQPVRAGYLFDCWKVVGGSEWDFTTVVTSSMTLEAQWILLFTVKTDGLTATVTIAGAYQNNYAVISWADGTTSTGSNGVFEHTYTADCQGQIVVTSTTLNGSVTSYRQFAVSAFGPDPPIPDPPNPESEINWIEIVGLVAAMLFVGYIIFVVYPLALIPYSVVWAIIFAWRYLL